MSAASYPVSGARTELVHRGHLRRAPIFLALLITAACPGLGNEDQAAQVDLPSDPTWVSGIDQLFAVYCNDCHGSSAVSASLAWIRTDTYFDLDGAQGAFSLRGRHLARSLDAGRPMPPSPYPRMAPAELAALERWIELGAPYDAAGAGGGETVTAAVPSTSLCAAGSTGACACPGGYYGEQLCRPDGAFGPCACAGGSQTGATTSPGTAGPTAPAGVPTLDDVVAQVFQPSCATSGCHVPLGPAPDLWTSEGLRARLVAGSAQAPGMRLVEPGNPGASYLFVKSRDDFTSLGLGFGGPMPPADTVPFTSDQLRLLEDWILAGAHQGGPP